MNKKNNWLDSYEIKARLAPAALCAVPAVVLYHYLLRARFDGLFADLGHVRLLGYLTIEAAATYAVMQLNNRLGGRLLQDFIFRGGRMPTTQLLMPGDPTLSIQAKRDIAKKFKKDFGKDLPLFDQNMTDSERRQRIGELMAHIRNATRDNLLVTNHNIEYGFIRNLCGGAFVAAFISTWGVLYFWFFAFEKDALVASATLLVLFSLVTAIAKPLVTYFGKVYGRVLLEQYLCN